MPNRVRDQRFDEVSTVDIPANQFGLIALAKRAKQEDAVADFFDADGRPVDITFSEDGVVQTAAYEDGTPVSLEDEIFDAQHNSYQFEVNEAADEQVDERALATVGKSAFLTLPTKTEPVTKSVLDGVREELNKALDTGNKEIIGKALGVMEALEKRQDDLEKRANAFAELAKREQDIRVEAEYISKAAEYNVPIAPEELGPVLKRCAESLSYEDCAVLHKALTASGEMLFKEAGYDGTADNADPFRQVEAYLEAEAQSEGAGIAKSATGETVVLSKEQRTTGFFEANKDAYQAYRNERLNRLRG